MGIAQYHEIIRQQELEGERIINYVRLFLCLLFPLLIVITIANNNFVLSKGNIIALTGPSLGILYSLILSYFLTPSRYKSNLRYLSPIVETTLITLVIIGDAFDLHASYGSMYLSAAYGVYFLFTTLSVLRLSFTASVFSGFMSMAGYLFVVLVGLQNEVFGDIYRSVTHGQVREMRPSLDNEGIKAFFILISGIISGYGSLRHKRLLLHNIRKTLSVQRTNRNLEKTVAERTKELRKKHEEIARDLDLARHVHANLLPQQLDPHIQVKASYLYLPYFKVGGDFFDIRYLGKGNFAVLVCDVSGHGVASALIASMARMLYEQAVYELPRPAQLLSHLNEKLYRRLSGNFLTMFYAIFFPEEQKLLFASAGHPPAYHLGVSGEITPLRAKGACLGLSTKVRFEEKEMFYRPNDRFFFYTDGVYEVRSPYNKEIFGEERLMYELLQGREKNGQNCLQDLFQSLVDFAGKRGFEDDLTALIIDIGTPPALERLVLDSAIYYTV
ncbi:MAG: serine/threonine-protein phosphatase [Leptospiraceae bacterium]|nr:serine/threonine-protein phosphatase [Leptospiraceae bacterium]